MNRKQRRTEQKLGKAVPQAGLQAVLAEAFGHHQAGRLALAEPLYQRVLSAEPRHADALHLYGVLACRSGRPALVHHRYGESRRYSR
jgi:Tfp pilus assembly protein PilF